MQPRQVIDWTDDRVAELREMAQTMTAGQIANRWGVSRNVVCGKMARLGIMRLGAPISRPAVPRPKPPRVEYRVVLAPPLPTKPMAPLVPLQMSPQAPMKAVHKSSPESVDIWQLTRSSCRYPLWHDSEPISQKFYCGDTAIEGLPYCDCHARTAFSGWAA